MRTTHLCHSVRLEVRGKTADELQQNALLEAAKFFGVPVDQLSVSVFEAEPEHRDTNGRILDWQATVIITLRRT